MRVSLGDCFLDEANQVPCPDSPGGLLLQAVNPQTGAPAGGAYYATPFYQPAQSNVIPQGGPGSMTGPYAPLTTGNATVNSLASWLSSNSTLVVAGAAIIGLIFTMGKR